MEFSLHDAFKNDQEIEDSPLGLLFLDLYLAKYEQQIPIEELEWISHRLDESDLELQRQRMHVWFLSETTNEHCSYQFSGRWDAPEDVRIPEWLYQLANI